MPTQPTGVSAPAPRLNADFWAFWTGQTISNLGSSFTLFALPLLVYQLTHSALNLGMATAAAFLPYLLFGLAIGAWVDRLDRKRMMIVIDVLQALTIASIPVMFLLGLLNIWWVYGASFVSTTLKIFFDAGEFAAIPSLVDQERLVTANGRIQASYSGASILGPLLAGVLLFLLPLPDLMFIDAASFLVSAGTLSLIRVSFNAERQPRKTRVRQDVVEGLRYVLSHPVLRNISLMMALVNFVGSTSYAQLVLFAERQLGASDKQVSLLYSAGSAGVVILSLLAGPLRKRWSFSRVALSALALNGLLTVALAFTPWYWLALPVWALIQGLGILFNINTSSLRQLIVPNQMLGRVMTIASVLAWSAIPLGTLLGGTAITATGNVVLVYAAIGALVFLLPVLFSFTALGHAERYLPRQETAPPPAPQTEVIV